jgi:hypothetical protein
MMVGFIELRRSKGGQLERGVDSLFTIEYFGKF